MKISILSSKGLKVSIICCFSVSVTMLSISLKEIISVCIPFRPYKTICSASLFRIAYPPS